MGIEPTSSAWKAEVLPLNYTRPSKLMPLVSADLQNLSPGGGGRIRTFEGVSRQIYSLLPLAAWVPLPKIEPRIFGPKARYVNVAGGVGPLGRKVDALPTQGTDP